MTWTGADDGDVEVGDDYEGAPKKDDADNDDADKDDSGEARKKDEDDDD